MARSTRHRDQSPGVPEPVERADTARVVTGILEHVRDVGPIPLAPDAERRAPSLTVDQLVDQLADRRPAKPRTVLGMSLADVAKFLFVIAAGIGSAYLGLRSGIKDNARAIHDTVEDVDRHEERPLHPQTGIELGKIDDRLDGLEQTTGRLGVRQETILDGLNEIKVELRDQRRRRPR